MTEMDSFLFKRLTMTIATCVIASCVLIGILVVVCCFWSKCPLYNSCRARYVESDVGLYAEKDMDANDQIVMPPEPTKKFKNSYVPNE